MFVFILLFITAVTIIFGWGFILWLVAEIGSKLFNIIGFCYSIVESFFTLKWIIGRKKINDYFYAQGLSKDQHSNVVMADFFNKIMLKKSSIKFGDPDETLSWYFAVNDLIGRESIFNCGLSNFGKFWARFLNLFEKSKGGHLNQAIFKRMTKENDVLISHGYETTSNIGEYKLHLIKQFESTL